MRVLVLSHKPPYPIVDGGCLAMSRFLLDLNEISSVINIDYLTLSTYKHCFIPTAFEQLNTDKLTFQGIPIDTRIKLIPAFLSLINRKSYHIKRFFHSHVSDLLLEKLTSNNYDVVIFESLYAAIYTPVIRTVFKGKVCYRSHNIEFRIWEDLAKNEKNPLKAWYVNQLAKSLEKEERNIWNKVNVILPISVGDTEFIKQSTTTKVQYLPSSMPKNDKEIIWTENRLCFLGAFDWEPNVEAVKWFIDTIFPVLLNENPTLEFHVAGRKSNEILSDYRRKNVVIHGFVEDPLQFIAENGLFVAGLQSGSGIKMKILEAMSIGAPCVLTNKAAEGLSIESIIPIHKNKDTFISDIQSLLNNKEKCIQRGQIGKNYIQDNFSSKFVLEILEEQFLTSV
jgi:glycosyltransferase involved in cell wall biosynthesis